MASSPDDRYADKLTAEDINDQQYGGEGIVAHGPDGYFVLPPGTGLATNADVVMKDGVAEVLPPGMLPQESLSDAKDINDEVYGGKGTILDLPSGYAVVPPGTTVELADGKGLLDELPDGFVKKLDADGNEIPSDPHALEDGTLRRLVTPATDDGSGNNPHSGASGGSGGSGAGAPYSGHHGSDAGAGKEHSKAPLDEPGPGGYGNGNINGNTGDGHGNKGHGNDPNPYTGGGHQPNPYSGGAGAGGGQPNPYGGGGSGGGYPNPNSGGGHHPKQDQDDRTQLAAMSPIPKSDDTHGSPKGYDTHGSPKDDTDDARRKHSQSLGGNSSGSHGGKSDDSHGGKSTGGSGGAFSLEPEAGERLKKVLMTELDNAERLITEAQSNLSQPLKVGTGPVADKTVKRYHDHTLGPDKSLSRRLIAYREVLEQTLETVTKAMRNYQDTDKRGSDGLKKTGSRL